MTHHDADQLAAWLADGPHHGPVGVLEDALATARTTGQRPGWLVSATGGTIAQPGDSLLRYTMLAVAVVALLGLLVGALIVGGVLPPPNPRPPVVVDNTADPAPSGAPEPTPTASLSQGLVAYTVVEELQPGQGGCTEDGPPSFCVVSRIEIANQDGSDAHRLFAGDAASGGLTGWSPDGSALLLEGGRLRIVDLSGSVLQSFRQNELCPYPCAGMETFSFSPDGSRIAFVRVYPDVENSTVIAILDLASREITELESTRTTNVSIDERCWLSTQCGGSNDTPRWSPDGTRIAFARQVMSPEPGSSWTSAAVYVVNVDGSDLRRLTPEGWYAIDPSWNADGSALVFINVEMIVNDDRTSVTGQRTDVYTVGADGADIRRLTNDGSSARPAWTADGNLTYIRVTGQGGAAEYQNWVMGPDGSDGRQLGTTLAALSAAGCVRCVYPLDTSTRVAFWQPMP